MVQGGVVAVFVLMVAVAASVHATFAVSNGEFSGRDGDTCLACHAPAAGVPAASVHLDGLPDRWDAGETYALEVRVEGGPAVGPGGRPQGGFEIEPSGGTFGIPSTMDGLLRHPAPAPHVVTYTPEGTRMRSWDLEWTAPPATSNPEPVTIWLAGMAANGNHIISGDDGESGDAVDALVVTVRASQETIDAWTQMPLRPPVIDAVENTPDGWKIHGHHVDGNATHLGIKAPDQDWRATPTGPSWVIESQHGLDALEIRSEGAGRVSPPVGQATEGPASPGLAVVLMVVLLVGLATRLRRA